MVQAQHRRHHGWAQQRGSPDPLPYLKGLQKYSVCSTELQ